MSKLITFQFESQDIRFVDGKPVANDIAQVLGFKDPANAVNRLVKAKNKGVCKIQTPGGRQSITVLEEAGIYQLIFSSKLPSAEKFQDWVFEEVLPSIRKTGGYGVNTSKADLQRVESRDTLKDEARLDLTDQVKVYLDIMKEKYNDPKKQAFFYARIHDALNVALTTETSRKMKDRIMAQFDVKEKDIDLIRDYFPNSLLIRYVSVCRVWASLIARYPDKSPLDYLNEAITLATGKGFNPTPIDFTESIKFVRHRLKEGNSQNLLT